MPTETQPSEPERSQPPSSEPSAPVAPLPLPAVTGPSLWQVIPWWLLRLWVLAAVPWALWLLVPPPVALAVGAALCALSLLFLSPWDLPWRPVRVSGVSVVLWDLLMAALLTASLYLVAPGDFRVPLLMAAAVLVLFRLNHWIWLTGRDHYPVTRGSRARWLAAGVAALLTAGLVLPLHPAPIQAAVDCLRPSATLGGASLLTDAAAPTGETDPDHLVGPALWTVPVNEFVVAGHGDTVVLRSPKLGPRGFAVRAADDGRVLWHVRPDRLRSLSALDEFPGPEHHPNRLHQVGGTVIAEYRVPEGTDGSTAQGLAVGYEAATGRLSWCGLGLWNLVSDPHDTTRFIARDSRDDHGLALYDAADGQIVSRLALGTDQDYPVSDPDRERVLLSDGRASVWSNRSYTSYAADSGEPLSSVQAPPGLDRPLLGLLHVGDVTVLAYGKSDDDGLADQDRHERYALAAHDADGALLWDSEGTGPLVGGEPVVGSTFDNCRGEDERFGVVGHRGFDGHFVALDGGLFDRRAVVVRASDGMVTSVIDAQLFMASCSMRRQDLNGRLHLDSGTVLDTEGVVTRPHNPESRPLLAFAGNGVTARTESDPTRTFHALP